MFINKRAKHVINPEKYSKRKWNQDVKKEVVVEVVKEAPVDKKDDEIVETIEVESEIKKTKKTKKNNLSENNL